MMNGKPNNMARNTLKYLRVDVAQRAALRREWNQPVLWPIGLIVLALIASAVPAIRSYRRREQMAAKRGSDPAMQARAGA
jgi:putative exporter of polyketide antibiotics